MISIQFGTSNSAQMGISIVKLKSNGLKVAQTIFIARTQDALHELNELLWLVDVPSDRRHEIFEEFKEKLGK